MEIIALIVTILFGVPGALAAWYGYKALRASEKQLELAREQAAQVPRVELMEVSLHPLGEDRELSEEVRDARQEMAQLQRERAEECTKREREEREKREREAREREEREWREKTRGGFNAETAEHWMKRPLFDPSWKMPLIDSWTSSALPSYDFSPSSYVYEGALPNHYLDVGIRNVGRAAAYDVTGWVEFEKGVLEPVEHFAPAGVEVVGEVRGRVRVKLSVQNTGGRLFPSHYDPYTFRIPVLVHRVADTPLPFEFTSPQGEPAHGTFNLLLTSGERRNDGAPPAAG